MLFSIFRLCGMYACCKSHLMFKVFKATKTHKSTTNKVNKITPYDGDDDDESILKVNVSMLKTVCMWRYQPNYFVCDGKSSLSSVPNPYKIDVIQTFENATIISPSNEENIQNYTHNRRTWKCNGERKSIYKAENNNKKNGKKLRKMRGNIENCV